MPSDKKAQAIYNAVHEALMQFRIKAAHNATLPNMDFELSRVQAQAASAAVAAYRKPLRKKR